MKKFKKIAALVLAGAMVLGMSTTAFAADVPDAEDKALAAVTNVEEGLTVTAYQIVEGSYNGNGFIEYVKSDASLAIADVTAPTSDEVAVIAKGDLSGLKAVPMTDDYKGDAVDGTYKAELEAGYWIVLVDGGVEIYNPMLVGAYYTVSGSDKTMTSDPVSADDDWTLVTQNAWAKSALPTIDKKINHNSDGNTNGNSVAVGDTVDFEIDTVIPSYSKAYKEVVVTVTDELSAGLALKADTIAITIGGEDFTTTLASKLTASVSGFTYDLSDVALANSGEAVVITYKALVDSDFAYNFDENTNTAKLEYTNNPINKNDKNEIDDKTYTYTFGIDALLNGTNSEVTKELFKVAGVDGKVEVVNKEVTVTNPLEGATFTLTNNATNKVYTATSAADGSLTYTGLDAGTYTLVETVAPEGYSINDETHTVVISTVFNEDGTLASYSITIDGAATSTYVDTAVGETKTIVKEAIGSTGIQNTRLVDLPSTGGIGTTIFTIGGVAIILAAAAMLFARRRVAR